MSNKGGNEVSQVLIVEHTESHAAIPDLRELLDYVRSKGRLLRIERAVSPEPDVQSLCRAASELKDTSLLFDRITGYQGKRLVVNLLASWANCALMCGLPADLPTPELLDVMCSRADGQSYKLVFVDTEKAPSYECLETGEIDLYRTLPLFRVNEHDGGFYLHKACIVSEDMAAWARHNRMKFGMYSLQVQGRDRLGVHLSGTDNLSLHLSVAEKAHRRLPVAVCLGVPPLAALVASVGIGYERTEYDLISALYEHPFELTRCVKSKLSVPACAEYVLEGYIEPGVRCPEGPFTCDGGTLSEIKRQPQIVVTAIAHRQDPILDNTYVGKSWTEHDCLIGIASTLRLHKQAKDALPEIALSGTHAEGVHLRLGFCGERRDRGRNTTGMSFQDGLLGEDCLSVYKQEIGAARRRQAQCLSRT
jgi:UbiD family decarboxylase